MPNSLDEEETQCLLACDDNLTSNYCDDGDQDDIEAQGNSQQYPISSEEEYNQTVKNSQQYFKQIMRKEVT